MTDNRIARQTSSRGKVGTDRGKRTIPHRYIDEVEVKRCSSCHLWLPLSLFYVDLIKKDGLNGQCKQCHLNYGRAHDINNRLKRQFNITPEEYVAMVESQGGVCAICGGPPGKKRLAVDHNHKTGKVRGLLCGNCNTSLGGFMDSRDLLIKAVAYLDKWGE